jgi:hypothetical protein
MGCLREDAPGVWIALRRCLEVFLSVGVGALLPEKTRREGLRWQARRVVGRRADQMSSISRRS